MQRNNNELSRAASSSIEITELDLGLAGFLCNNMFIVLLNYIQCYLLLAK